jgi:cysteine-rich repeat protein
MRHARIAALSALMLLMGGVPAALAQDCAGDCNASDDVAINELVTCVNIALGSSEVATCASCDVNGDGDVTINELIAAVGNALNGCTPIDGEFCGDGTMNVEGETCDDGNNQGGDGCAANCTTEIRRMTVLDPARALATAQVRSLAIPLALSGTQVLTVGAYRAEAVKGAGGAVLFQPGEIPVVIKAEDVKFDPVPVFGLACACVRGIPVDDFGPGISGTSVIGCGTQGLTDVDFKVVQDHDTTPGSPGNGGSASGLPDVPNATTPAAPAPSSLDRVPRGHRCQLLHGEQLAPRQVQQPARRHLLGRPERRGARCCS